MNGHRLTTLPGGLRVVSERLEHVRSVALGFWVRAGSRDELGEQAGISHFIEHLLFRGSSRYTALEIAQLFDGLGGELNAETSKDSTLLNCRVLDDHLERAVEVMTDMLGRPAWSDLDAERDVVLEEIAMYEDAPDDLVHDLAAAAVFGREDPLGRPVIGSESTIHGLGVSEVGAYHGRLYRAPMVVVSAAGSVDHDRLVELVERGLGGLANGAVTAQQPSSAGVGGPRRLFQEKETEQFHVCLSGPGLSRGDDLRFAETVLDAVLGGTASSRLFQEIRERRGMAYSVYSYGSHYDEVGQVAVYLGTRADNLASCLRVAREQVESLAGGGMDAAELDRAKEHLKGRLMLSLESTSARMSRLGKSVLTGIEILTPEEILDRIEAVTREEVAGLAGRLFDPERLSAAGIGPDQARFEEAVAGAELAAGAA